MSLERTFYRLSRLAGDARAIHRGTYPQRLVRRAVYRNTGKLTRRILRGVGL